VNWFFIPGIVCVGKLTGKGSWGGVAEAAVEMGSNI